MSIAEAYQVAILREIGHWPGVAVEFSDRSKHRQAVFTFAGRSRFITIPTTASDWRGPMNSLRDARKELSALGAARVERKRGELKRPNRGRGQRAPARPDWASRIPLAPVKPNPFEALAQIQFPPPAVEPVRLSWWQRLKSWWAHDPR